MCAVRACIRACMHVCLCMGVEERERRAEGGWSASLVRPAPKYPCTSISAVIIDTWPTEAAYC